MMGDLASRAASRAATTVEEEVTFCKHMSVNTVSPQRRSGKKQLSCSLTYNGGDGELLLTGVLEESEDIVANDNAGLAAQNIGNTHDCGVCR